MWVIKFEVELFIPTCFENLIVKSTSYDFCILFLTLLSNWYIVPIVVESNLGICLKAFQLLMKH